jgi:hypothetical protein
MQDHCEGAGESAVVQETPALLDASLAFDRISAALADTAFSYSLNGNAMAASPIT